MSCVSLSGINSVYLFDCKSSKLKVCEYCGEIITNNCISCEREIKLNNLLGIKNKKPKSKSITIEPSKDNKEPFYKQKMGYKKFNNKNGY